MRIQRQTRRSNWPLVGCLLLSFAGCAVTLVILALLLLPSLPGLALQVAGFDRRGATDAVFQADQAPPVVYNAIPIAGSAVLELGAYGSTPINQYDLITGNNTEGAPVAQLTLDENNLTALCREHSDVCGPSNSQLRNARIDLRPGGAIIFADVFIPQISAWQNLGAVVQMTNNHATIVGVDMGGTLYSPTDTTVSALITDLERVANEILTQLALNAAGSRYTLDTIYIDDQTLTLILR